MLLEYSMIVKLLTEQDLELLSLKGGCRDLSQSTLVKTNTDPEGGTGGPDPPGKSQVIWVSIGNKQLDPPPPPGKCWTPLEP